MRLIEDCPGITSFVEESIAAWNESSKPNSSPWAANIPKTSRRNARDCSITPSALAEAELQKQPATASARKEVYGRLTSAVARLACLALDLDDPYS